MIDILDVIEKEHQRALRISDEDPEKSREILILLKAVLDKLIAQSVNSVKPGELSTATKIVSESAILNKN